MGGDFETPRVASTEGARAGGHRAEGVRAGGIHRALAATLVVGLCLVGLCLAGLLLVASLSPGVANAAAGAFRLVQIMESDEAPSLAMEMRIDGTYARGEDLSQYFSLDLGDPAGTRREGTGWYRIEGTYDPATGALSVHVDQEVDQLESRAINSLVDRYEWEKSGDYTGTVGPEDTVTIGSSNIMYRAVTAWRLKNSDVWNDQKTYPWTTITPRSLAFTKSDVTQATAVVKESGSASWISRDGAASWRPLVDGDALNPGDMVRIEPDDTNPQPRRTVLVFPKGATYTVDRNSTVRIFDWGVQVEGGSVDVVDPFGLQATGFPGGKENTWVGPPKLQRLESTNAGLLSSAASSAGACRVEVTPLGTKVSAYLGRIQVQSTATSATVVLEPGQNVSVTPTGLGPVGQESFTDVGSGNPYATAIIGMALKGIVNGYQVGSTREFRPLDSVKRAQFAKMICGVMRLPVSEALVAPFDDLGPDVPTDLYPHEYVAAAGGAGITNGVHPREFVPYDPIKRAQVVTMIVRAANSLWPGALQTPPAQFVGKLAAFTDPNHGANMRVAEFNGLLTGLEGFGPVWNPWAATTRGEVAQMLWNLMMR